MSEEALKQEEGSSTLEAMQKEIATLNFENAQRRHREKELQDQVEQFNAEKKELEEKALAEKGEFKGLYEDLKVESEGKDKRIEKYEGTLKDLLEAETANIPEAMQGLIPSGDVASQLSWIAKAKEAKLFETPGGPDLKESGEQHGSNSISRQAFDSLPPAEKQEHISGGGKIHD